MKFVTVFAALLAVACSSRVWDLQQLSLAIESPHTDPTLKHYLVEALDSMMEDLMAGIQTESVVVKVPATVLPNIALNDLSAMIQNPSADAVLLPMYVAAQDQIMDALFAGATADAAFAPVHIPSLEIHHYTLFELSMALQDEETDPKIVPFLEAAINRMMEVLHEGDRMEFIVIAIPVEGMVPDAVEVVAPAVPAVPSSPLVQIIVNVRKP